MRLDESSGGAAFGAVTYELVYQPGNPGPLAPNAYTDLAVLAVAAQKLVGQKLITFDPSYQAPGSPMPIPAAHYDFRSASGAGGGGADAVWRTDPSRYPAPFVIDLADGVTLDGVATFRDVRIVSNNTLVPVITAKPENTAWYLQGWGSVQANGTQPFISDVQGGHNVLVEIQDDGELVTGSAPFIHMGYVGLAPIQRLTAVTQNEGLINADTLAGFVGPGNSFGGRIGAASGFIATAQAGVPGGVLSVAFGEQDQFIQHNVVPPNPAVWLGGSPGTVYDAIEKLATQLIARAGGGPI